MAELEKHIEDNLITTLTQGESQWTYCPEINNEEKLWDNFKTILEQNNKAILSDTKITPEEFKKIKNDVTHSSFYEAARWLVGENGKVQVHFQRGNQTLHLTVLDNNMIAGGSSVYQVINQYQVDKNDASDRDRRFDVSLLINGIPLIQIELKSRTHPYMEAYNQIKKYVSEGKYKGLFSNVQMFVVSNEVDTKYFAPARSEELNKKFLTGWVDENNEPVGDLTLFAQDVLKIPTAHEMVTRYTVLDTDNRRLIVLRPYQIHAIEAIRKASKEQKSGYIWHTTGSGKTLTSYKVARNLVVEIPGIDKTIFLVDRKDLDSQTGDDFLSYAQNDNVDIDRTDHVTDLIRRLTDGKKHMVVTTRQKLQIVMKRLKEGSRDYVKVKGLKVAFVVDECHRSISPSTKRELEKYFKNSLWYGFTGTPIFPDNAYSIKGDLPTTTKEMYGECLHKYTIKNAIKDNAVLGFMVEYLGKENEPDNVIHSKAHMRQVLDTIINKSYYKLGMSNGAGRSYSAILTVESIQIAQQYYKLLKEIKEGKDEHVKVGEDVKKVLPDFPKFAITYSLSENEESSNVNQNEMKASLEDYNKMFDTHYTLETIQAYNENLGNRLARKNNMFETRDEQLDLVIVVDRLLTGFNAPSLSTIYLDRPPMKPQHIIQTFSRTNRLFDSGKTYGQVVTCQMPNLYKDAVDFALTLYAAGGTASDGQSEKWEKVLQETIDAVKNLKHLAPTPDACTGFTVREKKIFINLFRRVDNRLAHLKAFTRYLEEKIGVHNAINLSEEEYELYAGHYFNFVDEVKEPTGGEPGGPEGPEVPIEGPEDYELLAYAKIKVDFEYIVHLIQALVEKGFKEGDDEFTRRLNALKEIVETFASTNEKLGEILNVILELLTEDRDAFLGKSVSETIEEMIATAIEDRALTYAQKWCFDVKDVVYEIYRYRHGNISNETNFKEKGDYEKYCEINGKKIPKFKYRSMLIKEFRDPLMKDVEPLLNRKY